MGSPVPTPAFAGDRKPKRIALGTGTKTMDLPELLTVADFCTRYSIGRTSFYREVAAKRIRIRKFGTAPVLPALMPKHGLQACPLWKGGKHDGEALRASRARLF